VEFFNQEVRPAIEPTFVGDLICDLTWDSVTHCLEVYLELLR